MSRRKNVPSLKRRAATRQPRRIFYIYCEGSVTEPDYINSYFKTFCDPTKIALQVYGGAGTPLTIVEKCVQVRRNLRSRRKYTIESGDEIWAVFDVDEHPKITDARALARANSIALAISNPCIELWGLLHFAAEDAPMSRQQAQKKLSMVMKGYHHDSHPGFPWECCLEHINDAVGNAEAGRRRREEEGSEFPNDVPSTSFDKLISSLRK